VQGHQRTKHEIHSHREGRCFEEFACALCPVPWLPAMTHPGQAELKTGKETHLKDTVASFARWRRSDLVVVKLEVNVIYGIWQSTVVGLK
jgi:hypothetical protein